MIADTPMTEIARHLARRSGALANLSADGGHDCLLAEPDPLNPGSIYRQRVDVLFVVACLRIIRDTQEIAYDETTWQDYLQMLRNCLGDDPENMEWPYGISKGISETIQALGFDPYAR